jgi:hypothetical protein
VDRRGFLTLLATGIAGGLTLDLDKLLWVPGAKTIFVPSGIEVSHLTAFDRILMDVYGPKIQEMLFSSSPLLEYLKDDSVTEVGRDIRLLDV